MPPKKHTILIPWDEEAVEIIEMIVKNGENEIQEATNFKELARIEKNIEYSKKQIESVKIGENLSIMPICSELKIIIDFYLEKREKLNNLSEGVAIKRLVIKRDLLKKEIEKNEKIEKLNVEVEKLKGISKEVEKVISKQEEDLKKFEAIITKTNSLFNDLAVNPKVSSNKEPSYEVSYDIKGYIDEGQSATSSTQGINLVQKESITETDKKLSTTTKQKKQYKEQGQELEAEFCL